jgi:site-specific recombinase XerD
MLLPNALDGYWLKKRRDLSPHTVRDYQLTCRRLVEYAGADAHIDHINTGVIRAFLNHLLDEYELSEKTICNAWTALSSLWTWAEVELNIAHVIRGRIKRPKYRRPQIETYSQVEAQAMLNACDHADDWTTKRSKPISI